MLWWCLEDLCVSYSRTRLYVKETYQHICQFCYKKFPSNKLQIHHILRRRDGGTDDPKNLLPLCESCHCAVHNGNYTHNSKGERIMYLVHRTVIWFILIIYRANTWLVLFFTNQKGRPLSPLVANGDTPFLFCLTTQFKLAFLVFSGAIRRVLQEAIPTIPLQLIKVWN